MPILSRFFKSKKKPDNDTMETEFDDQNILEIISKIEAASDLREHVIQMVEQIQQDITDTTKMRLKEGYDEKIIYTYSNNIAELTENLNQKDSSSLSSEDSIEKVYLNLALLGAAAGELLYCYEQIPIDEKNQTQSNVSGSMHSNPDFVKPDDTKPAVITNNIQPKYEPKLESLPKSTKNKGINAAGIKQIVAKIKASNKLSEIIQQLKELKAQLDGITKNDMTSIKLTILKFELKVNLALELSEINTKFTKMVAGSTSSERAEFKTLYDYVQGSVDKLLKPESSSNLHV